MPRPASPLTPLRTAAFTNGLPRESNEHARRSTTATRPGYCKHGSPLPNGSWPDRVCPARFYSVLGADRKCRFQVVTAERLERDLGLGGEHAGDLDRKSTRLNSSHVSI